MLEYEWYGHIGMTSDHLPRFHAPAENMIAITSYNGRGIAPGTVFGRELARHIAGEVPLGGMFLPVTSPQDAPFPRYQGRLLRDRFPDRASATGALIARDDRWGQVGEATVTISPSRIAASATASTRSGSRLGSY